ncbi:MAG: IgA Peptidase M64, partial [Acidobacteria bacterium]|nr:IgA Peptidase M64 [Acidobacteriota bacterium]
ATLRLDYFHTGTATEEVFSLDGLAQEGPWPGSLAQTVDRLNLGKYEFEVRDAKSGRLVYSRGFCSVYGEWETTEEARRVRRTFHESVRFPMPEAAVKVTIRKRGAKGAFRDAWSVTVDPKDPGMDRAKPPAAVKVWAVMKNGEPADKVDLLLIGDGYTAAETGKWHADAKRLSETLFAASPFKERRSAFNVWAIDVPADESGVARPSEGVHRRSPVRAAYDAFGSERYVLTFDNKRLREVASAAPYEFIEIVVNGRKYGGGGIHNQYSTVASDSASSAYVFVHEFGHHFAGLADEYYTSDVAYQSSAARPEPWEPNVTANATEPKWREMVAPGTPLPTPWAKAEFEKMQAGVQARRKALRAARQPEEEMEALFKEERAASRKTLAQDGRVGAFEGAMYESRGYYRPAQDCIMFTRSEAFCAVCRQAIERVIGLYSR